MFAEIINCLCSPEHLDKKELYWSNEITVPLNKNFDSPGLLFLV